MESSLGALAPGPSVPSVEKDLPRRAGRRPEGAAWPSAETKPAAHLLPHATLLSTVSAAGAAEAAPTAAAARGPLAACPAAPLGARAALPGRDLLTCGFRRRFLGFGVMCNVLCHEMGFW